MAEHIEHRADRADRPDTVHTWPRDVIKRNSWGAVFAGVVMILGVNLLLGSLGIAIGLTVIDPAEEANPTAGVGTGAMIWWVITGIIALFAGGWTAGRLAGVPRRCDAALHGAAAWATATLVTVYLIYSFVGAMLGGAWRLTANTLGSAGQMVKTTMPDVNLPNETWQQIRSAAMNLIQGEQIDTGREELDEALNELLREDPGQIGNIDQQDQQEVVDVLVKRTDMTEEQARQRVQQWVTQYEQAYNQIQQTIGKLPEKAARYGGKAIDYTATAMWWGFVMLLLGVISASLGGWIGAPKHLPEHRV